MSASPTSRRRRSGVRSRAGVAAGRVASGLSRRLGRGEGSVIGGLVCRWIDPDAAHHLAAGRRIALVTGTNGKTTTTGLLTAAMRTASPVATNAEGANLASGIVGALFAAPGAPVAVLEVDEAVLPWALDTVGGDVVVLLNLSRDQLDRMHEVRRTAETWRHALGVHPATAVVANADDPLVAWAAMPSAQITWVAAGQPWKLDAAACPNCTGRIVFDGDDWACADCTLRRPHADIRLDGDDVVQRDGRRLRLSLRLPGRCNRANAAVALAASGLLGVPAEQAAGAWTTVEGFAGRFREVEAFGRRLRLLLAKNPAGWAEMLQLLDGSTDPVILALNARSEDGMDPSWIWDVPFERFAGRRVLCTGDRAADLAVRLLYAGVDHDFVASLADALARVPGARADVIANYSAFQDARRILRGAGAR